MSQVGLASIQAGKLSLSDMLPTFRVFLGVNKQSVHFVANCHIGRSVTMDQMSSGYSVRLEMSLGCSAGGGSVKVPRMRGQMVGKGQGEGRVEEETNDERIGKQWENVEGLKRGRIGKGRERR